jgi:hypothetical protein
MTMQGLVQTLFFCWAGIGFIMTLIWACMLCEYLWRLARWKGPTASQWKPPRFPFPHPDKEKE